MKYVALYICNNVDICNVLYSFRYIFVCFIFLPFYNSQFIFISTKTFKWFVITAIFIVNSMKKSVSYFLIAVDILSVYVKFVFVFEITLSSANFKMESGIHCLKIKSSTEYILCVIYTIVNSIIKHVGVKA